MKELYFFFGLLLFFYLNEKFSLLNSTNIKYIVKNIILILPIISIYFGKDTISTLYTNYKVKNNINNINNINNNRKSRNVSNTIKKMVASNQRWSCKQCYNLLDYTYEIDHIIPLFKGGSNNINNLQALCRNCHGKKTIIDRN